MEWPYPTVYYTIIYTQNINRSDHNLPPTTRCDRITSTRGVEKMRARLWRRPRRKLTRTLSGRNNSTPRWKRTRPQRCNQCKSSSKWTSANTVIRLRSASYAIKPGTVAGHQRICSTISTGATQDTGKRLNKWRKTSRAVVRPERQSPHGEGAQVKITTYGTHSKGTAWKDALIRFITMTDQVISVSFEEASYL